MRAYVIRTTTYASDGKRTVQDFAVLSDSAESAMVAVIREQPMGVLIERTDRALSPVEARGLTLSADRPRLIP